MVDLKVITDVVFILTMLLFMFDLIVRLYYYYHEKRAEKDA